MQLISWGIRSFMKSIIHAIVRKSIKDHHLVKNPEVRTRYGVLEGWVGIIGNLILFGIKLVLGMASGSTALIADAVHTLGDSVTSAVVIVGFIMAGKPSDREHPFGHGRMESIAAVVIASLLSVAGFELALHAVKRIIHPAICHAGFGVMAVVAFTLVVKEMMSRFSYELGEMIDSNALRADAMHHRSDVAATAIVLVALIGARFGLYFLDGVMGVAVSLIIFYSAWKIFMDAVNQLLGEAPSQVTLDAIRDIALRNPDVLGVHDIILHSYGSKAVISLHIEVSDKKDAPELHRISEEVELGIEEAMGGTITVHIDPLNMDHPRYIDVKDAVSRLVAQDDRLTAFHDLRIVGSGTEHFNVIFDIALSTSLNEAERQRMPELIRQNLSRELPGVRFSINVTPAFAHSR